MKRCCHNNNLSSALFGSYKREILKKMSRCKNILEHNLELQNVVRGIITTVLLTYKTSIWNRNGIWVSDLCNVIEVIMSHIPITFFPAGYSSGLHIFRQSYRRIKDTTKTNLFSLGTKIFFQLLQNPRLTDPPQMRVPSMRNSIIRTEWSLENMAYSGMNYIE